MKVKELLLNISTLGVVEMSKDTFRSVYLQAVLSGWHLVSETTNYEPLITLKMQQNSKPSSILCKADIRR